MALPLEKTTDNDWNSVRRNFLDIEIEDNRLSNLIDQLEELLNGNRIVRGIVSSAGAIEEGTGFTVSHSGTGDYTITFSPAFSDVPSVVTGPGSDAAISASKIFAGTPVTASAARVITFVASTGAVANGQFHFIAIGPN